MWPLNAYLRTYSVAGSKHEEIQEMIERSCDEKHRREEEEVDLEERQQILGEMQRESARGSVTAALCGRYAEHTGFAFAGEEGHVPQIIENLKSY